MGSSPLLLGGFTTPPIPTEFDEAFSSSTSVGTVSPSRNGVCLELGRLDEPEVFGLHGVPDARDAGLGGTGLPPTPDSVVICTCEEGLVFFCLSSFIRWTRDIGTSTDVGSSIVSLKSFSSFDVLSFSPVCPSVESRGASLEECCAFETPPRFLNENGVLVVPALGFASDVSLQGTIAESAAFFEA